MLEGGLELLAVGTKSEGGDEARREVGVDSEAGSEGDGGENGGEGDEGTGDICNVGPAWGRKERREVPRLLWLVLPLQFKPLIRRFLLP